VYRKEIAVQLVSCLLENLVAVCISLLIFDPLGSFSLVSCPIKNLSDWYTVFYNPKHKHTEVIHCAQEAVYPFYSIIFVSYLIALILMVLFRVWVSNLCIKKSSPQRKYRTEFLYKALYLYPILAALHGVAAGLAYYSYPYIIMLTSLWYIVVYCVRRKVLTFTELFMKENSVQHIMFSLCNFATLSYSIIALVASDENLVTADLPFLTFVPFPLLFLLITECLSDPERIQQESSSS